MLKKLAAMILRAAERFYLLAHKWEFVREDHYLPPGDYPYKVKVEEFHRCHAVNAQRKIYADTTRGLLVERT